MKLRFKQLLVRWALSLLQLVRNSIPKAFSLLTGIIIKPIAYVWYIAVRPVAVLLYKSFVLFRERARTFFHAQHKMLAIITHKLSLQVVVIGVVAAIITSNILTANEVRAQEFAEGTLLSQVFSPQDELIITSETLIAGSSQYIDSSASIRLQPTLGEVAQPEASNELVVRDTGALVKTNTLGGTQSNTSIEKYTVQPGDTISTIAAEFGVTSKTILSSNNLTSSSLIKPGQELFILPTSGVAHTVTSGETVASIAKKYSADESEIIEFNNFLTAEDLTAGVEIIVPGGSQPAPVVPVTQPSTSSSGSSFARVTTGGSAAPSAAAPAVGGGKWQWPTSCTRISQYYQYRHTGIDVDCDFGDPIYAAEGGTVTKVAHTAGGYGLHVEITHSNGIMTRYAHLQKVNVAAGNVVGRGAYLGQMGSTGRSTGSHLHFEIIVNGAFINPYNYL